MTLLASRVDTLEERLDRVGTSPVPASSSGLVGVYTICKSCGVQGYTPVECYNGPPIIKHVDALHSFNPPPSIINAYCC